MEINQIIRIPIKYWELFNTMSNEESWKLIKSLFTWKDDWLTWLTLTYFNIIIVDINNLYNSASNWKKGGRPKNKPGVIEKENQGLWKSITNTSKDNISKDKIKESKEKYWEYKNVLLTLSQKNKLIEDFWNPVFIKYIKILDEWIQIKGYKYKDHNLVIRKWISKDTWKTEQQEPVNEYEKQKAERLARYWIKEF